MTTNSSRSGGRRPSQVARIVVIVLIAALVLAFAIDNAQEVEVGWLVGSGQLALWVVIVLSALAGAVVGYVAGSRRPWGRR